MTTTTTAVVENIQEPASGEQLVLRLRAPPSPPHVTWAADVIDNEHLGRLKSNCCCIYVKPRQWDDPSTWEQDEFETEHCRGHTLPERKKKNEDDTGDNKQEESHHGAGCC
ncbi:unnamed protein product [Caenorhabditis auriculariae]|uniref:Protein phosphatase 1 regulatory subunit 11 n=1 Tax=Caenorhabditis auriculariae TaxID=2777116 RepID=A0A8S1HS53_9PELO|nr:unnamed protein product [Caenorhabditis auriculariae]